MITDTSPVSPADISNETTTSPNITGSSTKDAQASDPTPAQKKVWDNFRSRVDACKLYRRKLIANWIVSIDYRRGKPFESQSDDDRISVNLDWPLTKAKQAALFSQVPHIRIDHPPQTESAGPWLTLFEERVNDTLVVAGIESAMDEVLPDCINAAGFGAIIVAHEAMTEDVEVPAIDVSTLPDKGASGVLPDGTPIPKMTVPRIKDHRYIVNRISPADLLWPTNYNTSNFDKGPWIGRTGRLQWAQAVSKFGLTDADRDAILGEERTSLDRLTRDVDKEKIVADEVVAFDEIFYKEFEYNPDAASYSTIHHLVFLQGKDTPVVDEPWKGQRVDPTSGKLVGATKFPIRILTLTYLTDESIPPSDSAIARPQINEINKGRTQQNLQRERSLPIRWVNVNGVDPTILQSLMRGTWQAMIPVQGDGSRYIGEVARAAMSQENFAFDRIAKGDLSEIWNFGTSNPSEAENPGDGKNPLPEFETRIGRERAKVASFFVSIGEVLGGLISLYEPPDSFGEGYAPDISTTLSYSILADSTVLVDANQRLQRLMGFINFAAKSGYVNIAPVLKEIASLSGLDPNSVIIPPSPKPPQEPNISLRLTGVEDVTNPLVLAFLMKSGQAPSSDLIEQAKQLINVSVVPPPQAITGGLGPGAVPNITPPHPSIPVPGGPPTPVTPPAPPLVSIGDAHPNWHAMNRVNHDTDTVSKNNGGKV